MPNPRPIKSLSYYQSDAFIKSELTRHLCAAIHCFLNDENPIFALGALTAFGVSKPLDAILFHPDIKKAIVFISDAVASLKRTKNPSIFITINIYINAFIYRVTPRNENENNKLTIENRKAFS